MVSFCIELTRSWTTNGMTKHVSPGDHNLLTRTNISILASSPVLSVKTFYAPEIIVLLHAYLKVYLGVWSKNMQLKTRYDPSLVV